MTHSGKRGLFASVFGSKKKLEQDVEAAQESRQRLETRIHDVLNVVDPPKFEPAMESKLELESVAVIEPAEAAQTLPAEAAATVPAQPAKEPQYTYMYLSTAPRNAA